MPRFRYGPARSTTTLSFVLLAMAGVAGYASRSGQPPARASAASRGKQVYDAHCAYCHGPGGKGDGPASTLLAPMPRDFTLAKYKIRSTDTGQLPTDEDLLRSVRKGLNGTAMPPWEGAIADADIAAVVGYVKSLSPRFADEQPKPVDVATAVAASPESVARGRHVYDRLQCRSCHGQDGRGTGAVAKAFVDDWNHPLPAADLTEPWTFRGGPAPRDIYLRFRTGMAGTPMPSFADAASDSEMWDLANYVASIARQPIWSMAADEVPAQYAREEKEAKANPVKRGEYLVNALNCTICHSPADDSGRAFPGLELAGGLHVRIEPFGDYYTSNLTSDKETGLGARSDEAIKRAITQGILHDGTRLPPYPMDWPAFSTMTDEDVNAIIAYLRTVRPISNKVPAHARPVLPVYLWGKFRMLILGQDPPVVFFPGNAGVSTGGRS